MTAGNIRNRHAGLGCFLHHRKLLIRRVLTAALDAGKDFYSINTVRHSRTTRLTPSSYLYGYVRLKEGLLQPALMIAHSVNEEPGVIPPLTRSHLQ